MAELTQQEANQYSHVFYRADRTGKVVRLGELDLKMLLDSEYKGFVLPDDFHAGLGIEFQTCLVQMGLCVESDFSQKPPAQRSIQIEMQPNFLDGDPQQFDLGQIVVKHGHETVAIVRAENA